MRRQKLLTAPLEGSMANNRQQIIQDLHFLLPEKFIMELESFKLNNAVAVSAGINGAKKHCCPQCLKAHALNIMHHLDLAQILMPYFDSLFPGKIGHDGYYLNQEKLFTI